MTEKLYVSVIGAARATPRQYEMAEQVGRLVAQSGAVLVCGGLGGVMEAAAKGAGEAGGLSIGILPGTDRVGANPYLSVAIPTGLDHARNYLVVAGGDGIIAVGGEAGTLSEIGLALKLRRPVVLLASLDVRAAGLSDPLIYTAPTAPEAMEILLRELR